MFILCIVLLFLLLEEEEGEEGGGGSAGNFSYPSDVNDGSVVSAFGVISSWYRDCFFI